MHVWLLGVTVLAQISPRQHLVLLGVESVVANPLRVMRSKPLEQTPRTLAPRTPPEVPYSLLVSPL